ncbi:MAG: transcription termination factor Rho [Aristaeellaceae bacterium]
MATLDLSSKTVVELRKMAKEHGVTLGAGVNKESIIAKLTNALGPMEATPEETPAPQEAQEASPAPEAAAPAPVEPVAPAPRQEPAQTQYRAAWHNPSPRYSSKPAYQAPAYTARQSGWQGGRQSTADAPRPAQTRPTGYTPRFGPAAEEAPAAPARQEEEYRPYRQEAPRTTGFGPGASERRSYGDAPRPYDGGNARGISDPGYDTGYQQRSSGSYESRPRYEQRPYSPRRDTYAPPQEPAAPNPGVTDLLAAGDCLDGAGVLEMHPDGYGFLRSEQFLPSSKDIYVSMAQIRRFGLRTGDYVTGKTRPQREGDKYAAMLYITEINGVAADQALPRPIFEELTPIYPTRRIDLEAHDGAPLNDMRLVDLIAPLGFGQRGLLLCPPDTGKTELLRDFANVICANHPEVTVMALLIDENPEDVTCFRDQVKCQVLASTFDQPPENHLRLADIVQERAQRLVEQGKDVVLLVDSLTRLVKAYTTTAAQQGRGMPGMVNPTSLFRAKKLFGAARCLKEGGSLTVIGAMSIEGANKVDDAVVEEFRSTANSELVLDGSMARTGVKPPVNLQLSGTRRAEMLLTPEQQEGTSLMRGVLGTMQSSQAVPQLMSMMDKAATTDELLAKLKDWVALMKSGRPIG